jgi:RNA polymerase sigma factor (sigma-70 family)
MFAVEDSDLMEPLRVLLVDEQTVVRQGLRLLLSEQPILVVVDDADLSSDVVSLAVREKPDVILLEPALNYPSALALLTALRDVAPHIRVLLLTGSAEPQLHLNCIGAGARGILLKTQSVQALLQAIETVAAGDLWFKPPVAEDDSGSAASPPDLDTNLHVDTGEQTTSWQDGNKNSQRSERERQEEERSEAERQAELAERAKFAALTMRERELIALMCQGLKTQEIAARLYISEKTVRNSLTVLYAKLEVRNRLELVFYGIRHGLANLNE